MVFVDWVRVPTLCVCVCVSTFLRFEGFFWKSIWDTFCENQSVHGKGSPLRFWTTLQRFFLFLGLPAIPESKNKVKTISANGCANLHHKKCDWTFFLLGVFHEAACISLVLYLCTTQNTFSFPGKCLVLSLVQRGFVFVPQSVLASVGS